MKTKEQLYKMFCESARYISINRDEGYYEIFGLKSLDTAKLYRMFVRSERKLEREKELNQKGKD